MATLEDFQSWIGRDIARFGRVDNYVEYLSPDFPEGSPETSVKIKIYTDTNCYAIVAKERDNGGYLGCIASSRKPRAGEDWTRGNDLADGDLSENTWHKILGDIISYEMVKIAKQDERANLPLAEGPAIA